MKNLLLNENFEKREISVGIVGVGVIGFCIAALVSKNGYKIQTYDINKRLVEEISNKTVKYGDKIVDSWFKTYPFPSTSDSTVLSDCNFIIIAVQTPIDEMKRPNLTSIQSACRAVGREFRKGTIICLESTVWPGLTDEVVVPILEKESGLKLGSDFGILHCPERIDPGNQKYNIQNTPRVIGGNTVGITNIGKQFYSSIINAPILKLSSCKAAEAVKILENTFRDVNIALVNEIAIIFEKLNIDLIEVINGAKTKPFGYLTHFPGPGVGGECIPVDPYYLMYKAKNVGIEPVLVNSARSINEKMPDHVITRIFEALNFVKKPLRDSKILVLGLTYKKGFKDTRNSPSLRIIKELVTYGANITAYDPLLTEEEIEREFSVKKDKLESISFDCIVLLVDSDEYNSVNSDILKGKFGKPVIVDTKHFFDSILYKKNNFIYLGVGR